jgi:hypothetical protein
MFDDIDRMLEHWVHGVVGDVRVSFRSPGDEDGASGVGLYLLELAEDPPARGTRAAPLRLALRYLVTTWGEPAEAHRLLGQLVFAALADPDLGADLTPLPPQWWSALHTVPRPAFILRRPVSRARDVPVAPPVTAEMSLRTRPMVTLEGVVLGPGDIPVAGARVRVPQLGKGSTTDARGLFRLPGVPASPPVTRLYVRARGYEQAVTVDEGFAGDAPVAIHIDFPEGHP